MRTPLIDPRRSRPLPDNPLAPPAAGPPPLRLPNLSGARSDRALIRSWLALKPSPHTQRAYARAVQDFLAWSDSTPLAAVTVTRLQAWRAHLETRLAPASVNARLAALKSLLAYAQRTGYLPLNVGAGGKRKGAPASSAINPGAGRCDMARHWGASRRASQVQASVRGPALEPAPPFVAGAGYERRPVGYGMRRVKGALGCAIVQGVLNHEVQASSRSALAAKARISSIHSEALRDGISSPSTSIVGWCPASRSASMDWMIDRACVTVSGGNGTISLRCGVPHLQGDGPMQFRAVAAPRQPSGARVDVLASCALSAAHGRFLHSECHFLASNPVAWALATMCATASPRARGGLAASVFQSWAQAAAS